MSQARRTQSAVALLAAAATLSLALGARAGDDDGGAADSKPPRYFYQHYDYGSQALYSPVWVFLNRGYDVLQDHVATRNILDQHYRTNTGNVLRNLANPFPAISADGWKTFLTEEIFPLSFTQHTARWVPNYTLHLIGGGTTYTALAEWFDDRSVPLPHLWSGLTLMASALVNETIENKGIVGYNTDAIADIWVFDIAGMILFSFDAPNRFFSREVVISDWSLQPTFTLPVASCTTRAISTPRAGRCRFIPACACSPGSAKRPPAVGTVVPHHRRILDLGIGGRRGGSPGQPVDDESQQHRGLHADSGGVSGSERVPAGFAADRQHQRLLRIAEPLPARGVRARPVRPACGR